MIRALDSYPLVRSMGLAAVSHLKIGAQQTRMISLWLIIVLSVITRRKKRKLSLRGPTIRNLPAQIT